VADAGLLTPRLGVSFGVGKICWGCFGHLLARHPAAVPELPHRLPSERALCLVLTA